MQKRNLLTKILKSVACIGLSVSLSASSTLSVYAYDEDDQRVIKYKRNLSAVCYEVYVDDNYYGSGYVDISRDSTDGVSYPAFKALASAALNGKNNSPTNPIGAVFKAGNIEKTFTTANRLYSMDTSCSNGWLVGDSAVANISKPRWYTPDKELTITKSNYTSVGISTIYTNPKTKTGYASRQIGLLIGILPTHNNFPLDASLPASQGTAAKKDYSDNLYFHFYSPSGITSPQITSRATAYANFSFINDEMGEKDSNFDGFMASFDTKRLGFVSLNPTGFPGVAPDDVNQDMYDGVIASVIDFKRNSSMYLYRLPIRLASFSDYDSKISTSRCVKANSKQWGLTTNAASEMAKIDRIANSRTALLFMAVNADDPMNPKTFLKTVLVRKPYEIVRNEYVASEGAETWQGYAAANGGLGTQKDVKSVVHQPRQRTEAATKSASSSNIKSTTGPNTPGATGGGSGGTANIPVAQISSKISLGELSLPNVINDNPGYVLSDWKLRSTETTAASTYAANGKTYNYYMNPALYTSTKGTLVSDDLLTYRFLNPNTSTYTETWGGKQVSILNVGSSVDAAAAFEDSTIDDATWSASNVAYESMLGAVYSPKTYHLEYNKNYGSVYQRSTGTWLTGTYDSLNKPGLNSGTLIYSRDNPSGVDQTVEYDQVVTDSNWSTASTVGDRYKFKGWYVGTAYGDGTVCDYNLPLTTFLTSVATGGKITKDIPNNSTIYVYPRWEPKGVIFKFKPYAGSVFMGDTNSWYSNATSILGKDKLMNDPTAVADEEHMRGTEIASLTESSAKGYEFQGWYTDFGCTQSWTTLLDAQGKLRDNVEDEVTLYAKWLPKKYEVTYNGNSNWNGSAIVAKGNGATNEQYKSKVYWYNEKLVLDDLFKRDASNKSSQPANQVLHSDAKSNDGIDDWQLIGYTVGTDKTKTVVDDAPLNDYGDAGVKLTPTSEVYGLSETNVTLTSVWRRLVSVLWETKNGNSLYSSKYMYNNDSDVTLNVPYGTVNPNGTNTVFIDGSKKFLGWALDTSTTSSKSRSTADGVINSNTKVIGRVIPNIQPDVDSQANGGRLESTGEPNKRNGNTFTLDTTSIPSLSTQTSSIVIGGLPDKNLDAYGNLTNNNGFTKSPTITLQNSSTAWAQWESPTEATLSVIVQNDARKAVNYYMTVDGSENPIITRTYRGEFTTPVAESNTIIKYTAGGQSLISKLNILNSKNEQQYFMFTQRASLAATSLPTRVVQTYNEAGHQDGLNGDINTGLPDMILGGVVQGTKTVSSYGFVKRVMAKNIGFGETNSPDSYSIRFKNYLPVYLHYNKDPNATDSGFFTDCVRGNSGVYRVIYDVNRVSFYKSLHMVGGAYSMLNYTAAISLEVNASGLSTNPGNDSEFTPSGTGEDISAPSGVGGGIKSTLELP